MKIKYKVILLALIFCSCLVLNLYVSSNKNSELTSNEIIDTDSNIAPTPTTQPTNENVTSIYNFPAKGIPVLMYHSISSRPNNSLCVPEIQFAKEMEWLSNQNYHCLTIEEFYLALVDDDPLPEKSILLTFDDGYVDNYKVALPILEHYNFKATFFIIVNSIGAEGMSLDQIKELTKKGYSIGSHTSNHLDLSILSAKRQENELMISKQKL
ncbi:MAG: polysaccharide deacetylase family protein, partial [Bacillota bacterium]|nr:polysaccharide deacetylase family protein [Bacillota bacterium]